MITKAGHSSPKAARGTRLSDLGRMYPPNLLPRAQKLLADLADIDFEHESDLETIRGSAAEEWLKQAAMRRLQERHQERRAPYLRQLDALQKRIRTLAA